MMTRLGCAAGAVLLLSVSFGFSMPRGSSVSDLTNASPLAPIAVARKHSSSSSSAGRRAWASVPRHVAPARSYVVAPYRTNASPRFTNSTPFYARPHTRPWRRLAPLATLSTIYIGSRYYYPYRYLPYEGPVCAGVSANGCEMQWMEVPTEQNDGTAWSCVEFCPQQ